MIRVIIVEDEKRARRGLKSLFPLIGDEYEIIAEAADGSIALDLIKTLRPDLVFTDIKMPIMDGMELIKKARAFGITSKFVIITAYEEFSLARQAIILGVEDYLVKPIILEDLQEVLERICDPQIKKNEIIDIGLRTRYPDVHPLILKALKEIENNYSLKINQKDLASKLGVSAEYFSYLFGREIGISFSKFLRHYRIEMAQNLLHSRSLPKEEIPYAVGFSEPKYFYKCFKEETGLSVTEFLRQE